MKNTFLSTIFSSKPQHLLAMLLLVLLGLVSENSYAQPTVLGSQVANGSYVTYDLVTRGGGVRFVRINATSSGAAGRNWEFATGTAGSTNYSTNWRPYTSGQQLSGFNTYIDPATATASARYNTGFGGQSGTLPAITSGSFYTFLVGGNSSSNNFMSVLSTTYNPKNITAASQSPLAASVLAGQPVTVTATISAALDTNERLYIRYSNDGFSTSTIGSFTTSGTSLTATIPGAVNTAGATVSYYIFSSNQATAPSVAQADFFTLNLFNASGQNVSGGGTNFTYTVGAVPTYTWNQTGTASWATGANWTPTRSVLGVFDNMIFNNGATTTVTNIPVETVGGILVSGNTTVNLQPAGANTLTIINGVSGADLSVASGSALNFNGTNALSLALAAGATGSVSGNIDVSVSANRILPTDASSLTFNSGSKLTQNTGNSGNVFGNVGTPNLVVFANGSTFDQRDGGNPFALTQPATKVTFQTGSLYKLSIANAPALAGRTYANFEYDSAGTASGSGGTAYSIDNLTVTQGTLNLNVTVASSIRGNISVASGATLGINQSGTGTVALNGTGVQTISTTGTGAIVVGGSGTLTVASGSTVDLGTAVITGAGTFVVSAGATFRTGNTAGIASTGATGSIQTTTRTFNSGANYVYNGVANQITGTGLPATVNTLMINNTGTSPTNVVTLSAITGITATANSLTLTAGRLDLNTRQLTIPNGGNVVATGGNFTSTAGPLYFIGSGTVSGTVSFPTVRLSGGVNFGTASTIVTSMLMESGSFVNTNAPTYGSASTLIYNTGGTYGRNLEWSATSGAGYPNHVQIQGGTTVDLAANGFADRAIAGNLNLGLDGAASAGSLSMGATTNRLTVGGNVIIGGNTSGTSVLTLSSAIGGDIYLRGNWDTRTNGSYASNTRAVFFEGPGTSTVTTIGAATFDFLFVNKTSGGTVSLANDMTVNNNLTLNAQLVTNSFKVIIPTGNNVTANAGGWVRGNLQKNIPTGTNSRTFEIGDASNYTPVTTAFNGVTGAGNITVSTTINDHPQIASSSISDSKSVNRYYTITNSGVTGGTYAPTFTFVAGDVDGGANTANFSVSNYINPNWTDLTAGTRTATTTQATGVSVYGDFQVGENVLTTWTAGAGTTAWATAGNWSSGVPNSESKVAIATASFYPEITTTVSIGSLSIASSTSLTVKSGGNITITDKIDNAGTLTVENNANLLQVNTTANTGSGSTVVKRNTAALMRQDYVLWSAPVAGQQLQSFSPQTLSSRFYTFDGSLGSAGQYVATSATGNFSSGIGYLIRMPNNHPTTPTVWSGTFTGGNAHNGTQTQSGLTAGRYYAVGNPYPSTIDADDFINDNSLTEAIYFWRKTNNTATSSYATYTLAGGVSNSGGDPLGLQPNGFIQVGQGFIAKVPTGESSLSFTNSMRVVNNGNQFLRMTQDKSRYWLNLTDDSGFFGQMLVAYMPSATIGYDPAIDGLYINDSETALTSSINGLEYIIQGRSLPFDPTDVVALGFKSELGGNYTIALNNFDGLFDTENQAIYLQDNFTNTRTDLRAGSYSFTSAAGVFNNRFEVRYESLLSTETPFLDANSVVVYKDNQELVVNAGAIQLSKVQVFDIRGRLLVEKANINVGEVRLNAGAVNQVVLVKITSSNNEVVTKKVVN